MPDTTDTIRLAIGEASAVIALRGAEPLAWCVGGRDLLWHGDPAFWGFRAPILFPVVGASRGGVVRVDGRDYPMAQHGFARHSGFRPVSQSGDRATLRLVDDAETRTHYPFGFALDVTASLTADALRLETVVTNTGDVPMPYGIGFHPAFPWPFAAESTEGHRVLFDAPEGPDLPEVAAGGLLARQTRRVPLDGAALPLAYDLFSEALVFLAARSRRMRFEAPSGAAIALETENLPHLAIWTKPGAPFLSLEAWSAHADWADAVGELGDRASMTVLEPGASGLHAITMRFLAAGGQPA